MSDPTSRTTADQAEFEALRERWELAKANGTVEAFVQELFDQGVTVPPPTDRVYESEEERAAYEWARAHSNFTATDLLGLLRLYFGDEQGIPMEQVLHQLETPARPDSEPGTGAAHASAG